ncbi:MAG: hypothetical protein E6J90_11315 [Deltaproteobacteria bacterium]|nr:MAG: hypothetical protein E6J91_19770 [Deltaproteobacteria bacterium]TMQ23083.1 MAG: hypothetical protein E6J90_11315 [Deltaproteobacteria bacterium]
MTVGAILELAVHADGTRLRQFCVDGVLVQVHALDPGHDAAAAELVATLYATCAAAAPPAERATPWGDDRFDAIELGPSVTAKIRVTGTGSVVLRLRLRDRETAMPAAAQLGLGPLEASRRTARIRVARDACGRRARRRARR